MAAIQDACAKVGLVSGEGLAGVLRRHDPRAILYPALLGLLIANTLNAGADLDAIAAGFNLLVPIPIAAMIVPIALVILGLQLWGSYRLIAQIFTWLTLALFASLGAAVFAHHGLARVIAVGHEHADVLPRMQERLAGSPGQRAPGDGMAAAPPVFYLREPAARPGALRGQRRNSTERGGLSDWFDRARPTSTIAAICSGGMLGAVRPKRWTVSQRPAPPAPRRCSITTSVVSLIQQHGVPLVALLIGAGELGVPTGIPAEVALLLAGSLAVHSLAGLLFGLGLVALADLLGTTSLHLVARTGGTRLLASLRRRPATPGLDEGLSRWRHRLGGHDAVAVFVTRVLPLVRMWAAIGAGLLRLRFRDFLLGAAPAALLWAGTPLTLGYLLRTRVDTVVTHYTQGSHLVLLALPSLGLLTLVAWWLRQAGSLRAGLHRGRLALGLGAAMASAAYVLRLAWVTEWDVDHSRAALPVPTLGLWLAVIAVLAAALLAVAWTDLRTPVAVGRQSAPRIRAVLAEVVTTLVWVGLLAVVGGIVVGLQLRYPAL